MNKLLHYEISGGESGIRTHDRVSPIHAFQACALNHSAISPNFENNTHLKNMFYYNYKPEISLLNNHYIVRISDINVVGIFD